MATTRKQAAAMALKQLKNENSLLNIKGQGFKSFLGIDKKRPADRSPPNKQPHKRSMLGDITNRENKIPRDPKKVTKLSKKSFVRTVVTKSVAQKEKQVLQKSDSLLSQNLQSSKSSQDPSSQSSQESNGSQSSKSSQENSYYTNEELSTVKQQDLPGILIDLNRNKETKVDGLSTTLLEVIKVPKSAETSPVKAEVNQIQNAKSFKPSKNDKEELGIIDIDAENINDPFLVGEYAYDIFEYYKQREVKFMIKPYLSKQTDVTSQMRAIVIDWLVEIQENFELNHETLYLAIRLFDLYLSKVKVKREKLQLVATAALFMSCKFDERCPPLLDDFLYICDDAYNRNHVIHMEQLILKAMDFDIGLPSSYRFLRRYSKCCKAPMDLLTMARYILEYSQMDIEFLAYRDSEVAAACLILAFKMRKTGQWSATLDYFTGYTQEHLAPLVKKLNQLLTSPPFKNVQTIKTKYSHKVFFEVAKTPMLPMSDFD